MSAAEVIAGVRRIQRGDAEWPPQVTDTDTLWVYGDGNLRDLTAQAVAVVGSRASTSYGEYVALDLACALAEKGWSTVSGGAFGIDAAAHRGCMVAQRGTVAVLACGVDRIYPTAHVTLFERIRASGVLVSAYEPGSVPRRERFLERNRLTVQLSRGVVVVEAATRSGSLSTARDALLLNRPLMAVPGPVTSATSAGTNGLIAVGDARLVTNSEDVIQCIVNHKESTHA